VTDNKCAYDEDIYEAYLLGCEDECLPEPKTREQFIEGWNRGMRSMTDNKPSTEKARECLRELLYCLCIGEVHVDEGFNGPIYHYMWEDEPKALKILKEFATQQQPDASKLAENTLERERDAALLRCQELEQALELAWLSAEHLKALLGERNG
jgi:hypothetical protein